MAERLAGRIAVVTGAARGLGKVFAERLAAEGADIALVDLSDPTETCRAVEAGGRRCCASTCDLSDPQAVERFAAQVGAIDILVNNAGYAKHAAIEDLAFDEWRRMWASNVDSMFLATKAFLPDLKRSGRGRIVNMTSGSVWMSTPTFANYISTKAAIVGFTHALATDLGPHGVTVNAIAPGLTPTPGASEVEDQSVFDMTIERQAIKRQETPEDMAGLVAFLASDEAAFITAQTIAVDGGLVRR